VGKFKSGISDGTLSVTSPTGSTMGAGYVSGAASSSHTWIFQTMDNIWMTMEKGISRTYKEDLTIYLSSCYSCSGCSSFYPVLVHDSRLELRADVSIQAWKSRCVKLEYTGDAGAVYETIRVDYAISSSCIQCPDERTTASLGSDQAGDCVCSGLQVDAFNMTFRNMPLVASSIGSD